MKKQITLAIALMFAAAISEAQSIPNGSFENWSNPNGYNVPDGWGTLNDMTSSESIFTATKGVSTGTAYLKLVSENVPGMGVMPGVAVSGVLDEATFAPISGFAYNLRPALFTGTWQYMSNSGNDIGFIKVYLTKWNSAMNMRDTIGYIAEDLTGMIMQWDNFSFSFIYNTTDNPDSCIIVLNASGVNPEAGSYLYVDGLEFLGATTGIQNTEITGTFNVFPSPAGEIIQVDLSGLKSEAQYFEITDLQSKIVLMQKTNGALLQTISVSELAAGNYFLKIQTPKGVVTQKISKQ